MNGSSNSDDPDRPKWTNETKPIAEYEYKRSDGTYAYTIGKGINPDGTKTFLIFRINLIPFSDRFSPEDKAERFYGLGDEKPVLYRLPELLAAKKMNPRVMVLIMEGEKDVETARELGFIATCNPFGVFKWKDEYSAHLAGCDVVVIPDNDDRGRLHASKVMTSIARYANQRRRLVVPEGKDLTAWKEAREKAGLSKAAIIRELTELIESTPVEGISLGDFRAYMPMHNYIYTPTGEPWPASSVNARLGSVLLFNADGTPELDDDGKQKKIAANVWLDHHQPVEQMTWAPGRPMLIKDKLIADGGWIDKKNVTCLNLYRPPTIIPGKSADAKLWRDHLHKIYPEDADHLERWFAQRVQKPEVKINHALLLGGPQGIGKDSALEPIKRAVGPWNFEEVSPTQIMGSYNGYLKSVIMRVSEVRDLGDVNRYNFYEHMKAYTAAPPDVLRVNEKYLREHYVLNCTGVIYTTNHKADGIYLPPDDRRTYVAWSQLCKEDFATDYWLKLWHYYDNGGDRAVVAYLAELDLSSFDSKAPPLQTTAFWEIVDANAAPEESELQDILDILGNPNAVTIYEVIENCGFEDLKSWLEERKNRRAIPHRFEKCGYVPVRNEGNKQAQWVIDGKRQVIYAKAALSFKERCLAAQNHQQAEDQRRKQKRGNEGRKVVALKT